MKKFIVQIALLMTSPCWANQTVSSIPAAQKADYVYLEFLPDSSKPLTVQAIKCDTKVNELKIQKFETKTKVANGKVNVVNLIVRAGDCKDSSISSVWQETIKLPKNGKHTHVHITLLSKTAMVL